MKKDPRVYMAQILERIDRILTFTEDGREAFFESQLLQDAAIRNLEVIGEAAKRVPDDYRNSYPMIPWRGLASPRDVLIHQYEGVSLDQVWRIIRDELPPLRQAISSILPPLDVLERELAGEDEP
jgi:uncharacterized protein with HEPN domain